jgi:hypothetical protein
MEGTRSQDGCLLVVDLTSTSSRHLFSQMHVVRTRTHSSLFRTASLDSCDPRFLTVDKIEAVDGEYSLSNACGAEFDRLPHSYFWYQLFALLRSQWPGTGRAVLPKASQLVHIIGRPRSSLSLSPHVISTDKTSSCQRHSMIASTQLVPTMIPHLSCRESNAMTTTDWTSLVSKIVRSIERDTYTVQIDSS